MKPLAKSSLTVSWLCRIIAALILLQTLFFKFSASPESVYIFTQIGIEPWGRIFTGVMELIAAILLLVPLTAWLGAGLALGIMAGAILGHLTVLGIAVQDDGGLLFALAFVVALCSSTVLWIHRRRIPIVNGFFPLNENLSLARGGSRGLTPRPTPARTPR